VTKLIATFVFAGALGVAVVVSGFSRTVVAAQSPAEVEKHIAAAKAAAGTYHPGLFDRICSEARTIGQPRGGGGGRAAAGGNGRRAGGPPPPPARETWHAEPAKVFDNMYYVGMTEYSAWAITTTQGIILIDAIYDYSVEDEVAGGLKKLGLNPADIKYVLISHGHLDHVGGAKFLQEKFNSRILMSAADWDMVEQQNAPWKPKRDMVVTDGQKLTLGDTTLTMYITPGHTPGTVSTIVQSVSDNGQKHVAAAWGGTAFNFGPDKARLQTYAASAARFKDIVAKAGADVLFANHTDFDGTKTKIPALAQRKPGSAHPYVIGTDAVQRYVTVANECAQAAIAALP
jgi:metallo-beta-lactamase class B